MCGIAGILNKGAETPDQRLLERMIATLRHRGPDESRVEVLGPLGFAHARLSIIDLSPTGSQPMANEDGSLRLVYNGEIFNYLELRAELEARGHRFAGSSDTEVILHAYEEKGESCVNDFNGQWAFALWDQPRKRLFLSRDRLGVRPLYYADTPEAFVFASELKALVLHPAVSRAPDLQSLAEIFTFWACLPPRTFLRSVRELPPGCSMTVGGSGVRPFPYWEVDFTPAENPAGLEELAEQLLELLVDATRLRLRADVPVGAYLSGGLDSSVVTSIIRHYTSNRLKTFSVSFQDAEFDESAYQRQVVEELGTEHHSVHCTAEDIGRVFPEVIRHTEKPIVRTAPAPLYLLSALVRDHGYKVVLTGEGSDEVLGGYDIYKETRIRRFWGRRLDSRWRPLLLRRLYPYMSNLQAQRPELLKGFFHVQPGDLGDPFFSHTPRWRLTSHLQLFFSPEVKAAVHDPLADLEPALPSAFGGWDDFGRAQYLETTVLLPGYILSSQGDRVAMAHSVEGRFPFLDYRVVEFGARLPTRFKMRGLNEKYLLKKAAGHLVPETVRRRPKQPYRAPDAAAFFDPATGKARFPYVEELLSEAALRRHGLFDPEAVAHLLAKARRGGITGVRDNMAVVGILSAQLLAETL
jgi:asparagine synthase (glutamine-hydrolysing)